VSFVTCITCKIFGFLFPTICDPHWSLHICVQGMDLLQAWSKKTPCG